MRDQPASSPVSDVMPTGPGAAAILAAGIGSLALGVLDFAGDASPPVGRLLSFWPPTGTLSGVTTLAIVTWLVAWFALARRWAGRDVRLAAVTGCAFAMLFAAFLLTFPPFIDLLEGR